MHCISRRTKTLVTFIIINFFFLLSYSNVTVVLWLWYVTDNRQSTGDRFNPLSWQIFIYFYFYFSLPLLNLKQWYSCWGKHFPQFKNLIFLTYFNSLGFKFSLLTHPLPPSPPLTKRALFVRVISSSPSPTLYFLPPNMLH